MEKLIKNELCFKIYIKLNIEWLYRISQNPKGHSKRVLRALLPCMKIFIKYLFEPRKQQF